MIQYNYNTVSLYCVKYWIRQSSIWIPIKYHVILSIFKCHCLNTLQRGQWVCRTWKWRTTSHGWKCKTNLFAVVYTFSSPAIWSVSFWVVSPLQVCGCVYCSKLWQSDISCRTRTHSCNIDLPRYSTSVEQRTHIVKNTYTLTRRNDISTTWVISRLSVCSRACTVSKWVGGSVVWWLGCRTCDREIQGHRQIFLGGAYKTVE